MAVTSVTLAIESCGQPGENPCVAAQLEVREIESRVQIGEPQVIDFGRDPWGYQYRIETAAGRLRVFSVGYDGVPHTSDDIDRGTAPGRCLSKRHQWSCSK